MPLLNNGIELITRIYPILESSVGQAMLVLVYTGVLTCQLLVNFSKVK